MIEACALVVGLWPVVRYGAAPCTKWPKLPHAYMVGAREGYIQFVIGMSILTSRASRTAIGMTTKELPLPYPGETVRYAARLAGNGLLQLVVAANQTDVLTTVQRAPQPHRKILPFAEGAVAEIQGYYKSGQRELEILDGRVIERGVLPIRDELVYDALCNVELGNLKMRQIAAELPIEPIFQDYLGRVALSEALEHSP